MTRIARGLCQSFVLLALIVVYGSDTAHTFKSTTFGFSYAYPMQLIENTSEFEKTLGPRPREGKTILLFSASEAPTRFKAREVVAIMADNASQFRALRDGRDYLLKVTSSMEGKGWHLLRGNNPVTLDGHQFFRADYVRPSRPEIYQTSVCTVWMGYAIDFILSAGTREEIDQLFRSLATVRFLKRTS